MSQDSKLETICDHRIFDEDVQIKSDLKTIPLPRALSSKNVLLYVNGYLMDKDSPLNGWALERDNLSPLLNKSKIILNKKRKSTTDFFNVTYSVITESCPKCRGLSVINDESYSKLGKLNLVQNEDKLLQEVRKGLTTSLGSNPFHTWIGTRLADIVGSKAYDIDLLKSQITQEVSRYIEKYIDIQTQQAQYQEVTDRESLYQLLSVEVTPDYNVDISYWTVSIMFQNRTGNTMLYEKKFEIPGPQNLLYGS